MKLMQVNITSKRKVLEKGKKDKKLYHTKQVSLHYLTGIDNLYSSPLTNVPLAFKRLPNYAWYVIYSMITYELGPEISPGRFTKRPGLTVDLAQLCSHSLLIEDHF